jgi:pimeloyl-ACP methyl ester carboxylesterase
MKLEPLSFAAEGYDLAGLRYIPAVSRASFALLLVHGYTAGKYSLDSLACYLAMRGVPCVTIDLAGHKLGASGGIMQAPQSAVDDVKTVVGQFVGEYALAGHSLGAAACLAAAADLAAGGHPPRFVISMAMGEHPARGFQSVVGKKMLEQRDDYVIGAPAALFVNMLDEFVNRLTAISCPALFIAARQDVLLPPDRVFALADRLSPVCDRLLIESSHMELPDTSRAPIYSWLKDSGKYLSAE